MSELLIEFWELLPLKQFFCDDKRIFWPFLLLSAIYIVIFGIFFGTKYIKESVRSFTTKSAMVDYGLWTLNHIFQVSVLPLSFGNGLLMAVWVDKTLYNIFGLFPYVLEINFLAIMAYSILLFIGMDYARFLVHYYMHKISFFAAIHNVHHHAEVLTPITLFRVHPLEMLIAQVRYLIVFGLITGIFMYIYNDTVPMIEILGANAMVLLSNVLAANLRHSHIPISFGVFERIFISPKQHQMHHAKNLDHEIQNLGSMLAIWDLLYGTWRSSVNVTIDSFGTKQAPKQSVWAALWYPIHIWLTHIGRFFPRRKLYIYEAKQGTNSN